jgi:Zn-dependent peptidase ImmA (M78 family)
VSLINLPLPEEAAGQLRAEARLDGPILDVEGLARYWPGLRIDREPLSNSGYLIDLGSVGTEIIVRADDSEPRQRFTIAHEFGHLFLKREHAPWGSCQGDRRDPAIEKWCDLFAASLLMPRPAVLEFLRRGRLEGLAKAIVAGPNHFNVSALAFQLRVTEISPVSVVRLTRKDRDIQTERVLTSSLGDSFGIDRAIRVLIDRIRESSTCSPIVDLGSGIVAIVELLSDSKAQESWLGAVVSVRGKLGRGSTAVLKTS